MSINNISEFSNQYSLDDDVFDTISESLNNPLALLYCRNTIEKLRQLHVSSHGFSTELLQHHYRNSYLVHDKISFLDSISRSFYSSNSSLINTHLSNLRIYGYTVLEEFFSSQICAEVQSYLLDSTLFHNDIVSNHSFLGSQVLDRAFASVFDSVIQENSLRFISRPHSYDLVDSFKYHPLLLSIISCYLGTSAISQPSLSFLSLPSLSPIETNPYKSIIAKSKSAQLFHFDFDHTKWLKIFVNWSDVTSENGPHEYLSSTHLKYPSSFDPRPCPSYNHQSDFDRHFATQGEFPLTTFILPKGSVLIEDTCGLHRGTPLSSGYRLLSQFIFSASNL